MSTCPSCAATLPGVARFCPRCGAATASAGAPPTPGETSRPSIPPEADITARSLRWLGWSVMGLLALMVGMTSALFGPELARGYVLGFLLSVLAGTLPVLFYVALVLWVDRHEREPGWLLFGAFFWGAVVAIVIAGPFNTMGQLTLRGVLGRQAADALTPPLVAPLVEELTKAFALLLIFLLLRHEFDNALDGIVYGSLIGLGFELTENTQYYLQNYAKGGLEAFGVSVYVRGIWGGFGHALYTGLTGAGFGLARELASPIGKVAAPVIGLGSAMFLHALWNSGLVPAVVFSVLPRTRETMLFVAIPLQVVLLMVPGLLLLAGTVALAWRRERRTIVQYLRDEVESGVVLPAEFAALTEGWFKRLGQQWAVLTRHGLRAWYALRQLYDLQVELAFRKWHTARGERLTSSQRHLSEEAYRDTIRGLRAWLRAGGVATA